MEQLAWKELKTAGSGSDGGASGASGSGSLLDTLNPFDSIAARHEEYRKNATAAAIESPSESQSPTRSASRSPSRSFTPRPKNASDAGPTATIRSPISSSPIRHMTGLRLDSSSPQRLPNQPLGVHSNTKEAQIGVRNAVLKFCQLDHSMTLLKQQMKELETKKGMAQRELTAACKQVNVFELDLSLLPHDILQSIGGPGTLKLKVRKRVGSASDSKSRSGGSSRGSTAANDWYKEVCLYALKQQQNANPESTLNDWVKAYETDQNYEPVDIRIQRERKRLKVLQPAAQVLPYDKTTV